MLSKLAGSLLYEIETARLLCVAPLLSSVAQRFSGDKFPDLCGVATLPARPFARFLRLTG